MQNRSRLKPNPMKKLLSILVAFTFFITLTSCLKTQHGVRINNQNIRALNVVVGSVDFGKVFTGVTTNYQNIPEGSSPLGGDLTGSINVTGKGIHKWTLTITSSGGSNIVEDK